MAWTTKKLVSLYQHPSPQKHDVRHAFYPNSFKHGVVHAHVVSFGADGVLAVGIEYDEVGIAAHSNCALLRIKAEEFGRCGSDKFYEPIHAKATLRHATRKNQAHSMLDPGAAVGNLGEVADAEFLLIFKTEWTMIGRDDLQVIVLQSLPE